MESVKTIDAHTLNAWLSSGQPISLLDIRPMKERMEWRIPHSLHIDAYDQLKAGNDESLQALYLDKKTPVVTFCAGGKLSLFAAEILTQRGYSVFSLEGGMKAWNYAWNTAETQVGENLSIIQVRRLAKGCLSYLIASEGEAMVIDANLDPEVYLQLAQEKGWKILHVADTHVHADYVSRTKELALASGATHYMLEQAQVEYPFTPIKDGEEIELGGSRVVVLHTPGHTDESISFWLEQGVLLTGDTLFTDGIGRPDLKADEQKARQKASALFKSLQKILLLDPATVILPAHLATSLGLHQGLIAERLDNLVNKIPALELTIEEFVQTLLDKLPPTPPNYLAISAINRSGNHADHNLADLEAGANRCAIQ